MTHLNDISKVYLENVQEGYDKPDEKLKTDRAGYSIPKSEQMSAAERIKKKTAEKRAALEKKHGKKMDDHPEYPKKKYVDEKLDPVGQEDKDIDNDGDVDSSDKYLHKRRKAIAKAMKEGYGKKKKKKLAEDEHKIGGGNLQKLATKATKRVDADVDGDVDTKDMKSSETGEYVPGVDGKKVKSTFRAEGFSNWRGELTEVMSDSEEVKKVVEKKVNNKIDVNPKLGEAVQEIGGELIEATEVSEMEYIIESIYIELQEEGYECDDIEDAIDYALNEVSDKYYDSAVKASKDAAAKKKREEMKKKAIGRLKFMKRKVGEKVKGAKQKVAQAQVDAYNKGREVKQGAEDKARRAKETVKGAPKRAKRTVKGMIKRAAEKVVQRMSEATGPALPGEPGRPGTPKAPGGRPHLPGEKQTPAPKKTAGLRLAHTEHEGELVDEANAGPSTPVKYDSHMKQLVPNPGAGRPGKVRLKPGTPASSNLRLAHTEHEGDLVDENVATGKAKRAKRGGIAQRVGAGEVISNKERDAAYAKKKAANAASDAAAGDAAHKAATDKGLSPAEAMMRKRAAERKAARERARKMK
jgi:hypothetical protein